MAASLRRLLLLVVALGVAAVLLVGATAALAPATPAQTSPVLQRDQVARRTAEEPGSKGSRSFPVVALVLGGLLLLATLPPIYRVHVYYHRPPGSSWY
jgi:hypothetical protein